MTEVWMYSIPVTIALAGLFHFLLADYFKTSSEESGVKPLLTSWLGFAFLLILDSVYAIHLIAQDTTSADLTSATRVAYILTLISMAWTALYMAVLWVKNSAKLAQETGTRWRR